MPAKKNIKTLDQIPHGVWMLGLSSLCMDISSEMIHSLLPLFLTTLGASTLFIGFTEGIAESLALMIRIFSGAYSDFIGKRKELIVLGYCLAAFSKPLFALANSSNMVLTARIMDRLGKGIRAAPRDAFIADIVPSPLRGAAYGLRQSMDSIGAVLGPLIATFLMLFWADNFRAVFWVATIPALLAGLLILFGIKESRIAHRQVNPIQLTNLRKLNAKYWRVVLIGIFFTLARFSEAFIVLRAQQNLVPLAFIPLLLVILNIIFAASAYPFGKLSDQMSHNKLLGLGFVLLIAADLFLAINNRWDTVLLGVILWGLHMGVTQGLLATMVASSAPRDLRGTAYGIFNLVTGFYLFIASALAGFLWEKMGAAYTFYGGIVFSLIGLLLLSREPKFNISPL